MIYGQRIHNLHFYPCWDNSPHFRRHWSIFFHGKEDSHGERLRAGFGASNLNSNLEEEVAMRWILTPTQQEYNASYKVQEQLRHERLERQVSLIDYQESTPSGEPAPSMTMDRYRKEVLNKEVERVRDIWKEYTDELL